MKFRLTIDTKLLNNDDEIADILQRTAAAFRTAPATASRCAPGIIYRLGMRGSCANAAGRRNMTGWSNSRAGSAGNATRSSMGRCGANDPSEAAVLARRSIWRWTIRGWGPTGS